MNDPALTGLDALAFGETVRMTPRERTTAVDLRDNFGAGFFSRSAGDIDIPVGQPPTITDLPTDVAGTEDTTRDLDLSEATLADVDSLGPITVVLTASTGTMTAASGGGVTVTGSGSGVLTLVGTAADIDTFLNAVIDQFGSAISNIKYTPALNLNGDDAATVTLTANDGSGSVTLGVVNIDINPVNDIPTATGLPADVTVLEDQAGDLDLSAVTFGDVDTTSNIAVQLVASAGTLAAVSGGGVSVTGSGTGSIILLGTAGDLDAYLNTASNIQYTGAPNVNGQNAATVSFSASDGSTATILGIINIDITSLNDAPTVTGIPSDIAVTEGVPSDIDLSTLTLEDADAFGSVSLTLTASSGTMTAMSGSGVVVTNSGTGSLTLAGVIADIEAFLSIASNIQYTGAPGINGNDAAVLSLYYDDGFDAVWVSNLNIDIAAAPTPPSATGLPTDVIVTEDTASNLDLSSVTLVDIDTAGPITVILTASTGVLVAASSESVTVSNSGTGAITLTGTAADIDAFLNAASNIQYTGASNANGDNAATLTITANDGSGAVPLGVVNIDITAVNDAPSATGVPADVTVTEDAASNLNLSAITLSDIDTAGPISVTLTASAGILTATSSGAGSLEAGRSDTGTQTSVASVTVTNSGTGAITLTGTASAIDAYLNTASNIKYTGALNANGDNAATITITANDGSGSVQLGVVNIDITGANDTPTLTGVASSVTFLENTVNAAPQLIDSDVTFADVDGSFAVGSLTVTGLLAQDTVSIRNQGVGAGQVGLSGGVLTYGGVPIGNVSGGAGGTLTISFNAIATPQAVDAVIQNLTYANASDTPTASRVLTITATDGGGLAASATVTVNVTPEADITTINGTTRNDTLTGTAGADQINGRDGADTLSGGNGDDRLDGGKGADKLNGGDGADHLNGGADNDRLDGGVGNDTLLGGSGNDTLIGGAGNDTMGGGSGADIYLFNAGLFGADKITDFGNGLDKIQFSGIAGVTSFANLAITAVSGGVLITLPDGSTINIAGMNVAQTDASDFIFGP